MIVLREISNQDKQAVLKAFKLWESSPGFAFLRNFEPEGSWDLYLERLDDSKQGRNLAPGIVAATSYFAFDGDEVVGSLNLRHELNEYLLKMGGHIGYGVLTPYRGRGYAKAMLQQSLSFAKKLGLRKVLLTCDQSNAASRRTIESSGGVLENIVPPSKEGEAPKMRFWIQL